MDQTRSEYRLNPDMRREAICEIHTIQKVSASSDPFAKAEHVAPYFSYNHEMNRNNQQVFWHARRQDTGRPELPGTEIYLSFVDLEFAPTAPAQDVLFAHTLCTNRFLAEEIPAGAILQVERAIPTSLIRILKKPTPQLDPPIEGRTLWRLISHLSLNYLSLSDSKEGLRALREILRLYSFTEHTDTYQQVSGINEMSAKPVVRLIGTDAWRGFCQGVEITLTFDERQYVGSSAFLLASVLNRFFALYSSVNSFTPTDH